MTLTAARIKSVLTFAVEQKASLESAYSGGLVTTGMSNSEANDQLVKELKLDVPIINRLARFTHSFWV